MIADHIILAIVWILYGVIHSVLANRTVKKNLQQKMGRAAPYYRIIYTLFAFLSMAAVIYYQVSLPTRLVFEKSMVTNIAGGLLSFSGLVLMLVCIKKYFISLSGLRSLFSEKPEQELIITGVHRYVRHPLYLGTFAFLWGLFLLIPQLSLLVAITIITVYTLIGIGLEEEKLVMEFGESYSRYREKVPALFPRLRLKRKR